MPPPALPAAYMYVQHLPSACVHAQLIHSRHPRKQPCRGRHSQAAGRHVACGNTTAPRSCLVACCTCCAGLLCCLLHEEMRLLAACAAHSRSSEKKSRAMKRPETSVMTPPAVVRLKNSAASSRCRQKAGLSRASKVKTWLASAAHNCRQSSLPGTCSALLPPAHAAAATAWWPHCRLRAGRVLLRSHRFQVNAKVRDGARRHRKPGGAELAGTALVPPAHLLREGVQLFQQIG